MTDYELISERAAAKYLGISRGALRRLRCEGFIDAAQVTLRDASYHPSDVEAFGEAYGFLRTYDLDDRITIVYDECAPMRASLLGGVAW